MTGVTGLMEDTTIHDSSASKIVYSLDAASATLRRCHVYNYAETNFVTTLTLLEGCLFEAATADAVDFDGAPPGSVVRQCTFRNGPTGTAKLAFLKPITKFFRLGPSVACDGRFVGNSANC